MKILEIANLNKIFITRGFQGNEKAHVLKNINFSVGDGQMVAIVGESGCGKTTLGKIMAGILTPDGGDIYYRGHNMASAPAALKREYRKDVQFIQQDSYAALNPMNNIYNSLYAPIKANNKGMPKAAISEKIKTMLCLVGLTPPEQFLDKFPHQLSGGQRQRILIARVLSLNPRLVIADEPISMIDVSLRLSILELIFNLNKNINLSVCYITHDLSTVKYAIGNGYIAIMYLGEIVEYGRVDEVLENPRHPYTQALISSVPVPDPRVQKAKKAIQLKSMEIPSIRDRCPGCSFHTRCLYADAGCISWDLKNTHTESHYAACKNIDLIPRFSLYDNDAKDEHHDNDA